MFKSHNAVSSLYDGIWDCYEAVNFALTLGFDRYWRARAVSLIKLKFIQTPSAILDICCGTGDFTFALKKKFGEKPFYSGCDLNEKMLSKARIKVPCASFFHSDCGKMPFPDSYFDLVTISFATRNLFLEENDFKLVMKEVLRVMKKGGIFASLETTVPQKAFQKNIMFFFVKIAISILNKIKPSSAKSFARKSRRTSSIRMIW